MIPKSGTRLSERSCANKWLGWNDVSKISHSTPGLLPYGDACQPPQSTGAADANFIQVARAWAAICRRNLAGARALRGRRSMRGRVCRRSLGLLAGLGLLLGACTHSAPSTDAAAANSELNTPPTDYKREIL